MTQFHDVNVVFRCSAQMKARMKALAEANDQHLSAFIRSACSEILLRGKGSAFQTIPSVESVDRRLSELVR